MSGGKTSRVLNTILMMTPQMNYMDPSPQLSFISLSPLPISPQALDSSLTLVVFHKELRYTLFSPHFQALAVCTQQFQMMALNQQCHGKRHAKAKEVQYLQYKKTPVRTGCLAPCWLQKNPVLSPYEETLSLTNWENNGLSFSSL